MLDPVFAVAPRNAEIVLMVPRIQLDDAETFSYQIDAAVPGQNSGQLVVGDSVDLYIEILGLAAEKRIAHRAAHHHRPIAGRSQLAHDLVQLRGKIQSHGDHRRYYDGPSPIHPQIPTVRLADRPPRCIHDHFGPI